MAKMAALVGLPDRAAYWAALATNVTKEMDELLWDEATGFYYDMWFNGTLMPIKTVAGMYVHMQKNKSHLPGSVFFLEFASSSTRTPMQRAVVFPECAFFLGFASSPTRP